MIKNLQNKQNNVHSHQVIVSSNAKFKVRLRTKVKV